MWACWARIRPCHPSLAWCFICLLTLFARRYTQGVISFCFLSFCLFPEGKNTTWHPITSPLWIQHYCFFVFWIEYWSFSWQKGHEVPQLVLALTLPSLLNQDNAYGHDQLITNLFQFIQPKIIFLLLNHFSFLWYISIHELMCSTLIMMLIGYV